MTRVYTANRVAGQYHSNDLQCIFGAELCTASLPLCSRTARTTFHSSKLETVLKKVLIFLLLENSVNSGNTKIFEGRGGRGYYVSDVLTLSVAGTAYGFLSYLLDTARS